MCFEWRAVSSVNFLASFASNKPRKVYLSFPLAVQVTFPFVWVAGDVPDVERLSNGGPLPGPRSFARENMVCLSPGYNSARRFCQQKKAGLLEFVCRRASSSAQPFLLHHLSSSHSRTQLCAAPQLASYVSSCSLLQTYLHRYIGT